MSRWLYSLLIFSMLALVLSFLRVPAFLLFAVAGLGIIPLAALIGQSVEEVAEHTGERIGGLLFATFGNATELIIGILALSKGLVDVVSASIIGSILGNLLLVLGIAVCIGSFKHGRLLFEARPASQYASLFALCIAGLLLPTIAELLAVRSHQLQIFERGVVLSDFIAVLLLLGYLASILFSVFRIGDREPEDAQGVQRTEGDEDFDPVLGARSTAAVMRLLAYRHHLRKSEMPGRTGVLKKIDGAVDAIVAHEANLQADTSPKTGAPLTAPTAHVATTEQKKPSLWRALVLLVIATVGVGVLSEILVGTIEPMAEGLGWNTAFVGLVFLPLIGGIPEYFNTIGMALDKRIGMVLAASAGSSIQIALLIAPILVLVSLMMPARLDLVFSIVEIAVLAIAAFLYSEITRDGELVWLEGLLLILLYTMMAGTVFLFGSGKI